MRVVIAPDSFGGMLSAIQAADAVADGWRAVRPDDDLAVVPMSDGGEGLLDAVAGPGDDLTEVEVAGPLGLPVMARMLRRNDLAVLESAQACGLHLVPPDKRDPLRTTTYGVGQLLDAARRSGARRILVGLGGSSTVDGGAGALTALGFRLRVEDGSGLKIGGFDLHRIHQIERGWAAEDWTEVEVHCLADVTDVLRDAPSVYGPQKGADSEGVRLLEEGLAAWEQVVARDLDAQGLSQQSGTGAAGGLGYGLAAALGADLRPGVEAVADLVGLPQHLEHAELVITGEGRLDRTSFEGKVVGALREWTRARSVELLAVVGVNDSEGAGGLDAVEEAPAGSAAEARTAVSAAASRLARMRQT